MALHWRPAGVRGTISCFVSRVPAWRSILPHCHGWPGVFRFAVETVPRCVEQVLQQRGCTVADVDCFVFHQANARIIRPGRARKLYSAGEIL